MLLLTISLLAIFSGALAEAEDIDESADLGFGLPDETIITSTTSIPSTTNDPIPKTEIKHCGLFKNKTCVKRSDCSTTMRSGSKLIVDLKVRAKSGCHYLEVCCHPDDMLTPMNGSIPLGYKQCGIGNVGGIFMDLIGGRLETSLAEYPYMVAILDTGHRFICNGVLIGYKVVLTTATCLSPEQPLVIRAGDWDLSTDSEFVPHVDRGVQYRIVHQQFNWDSIKNNIALLVLVEQFPRVQHIIPICLDHNGVDLDYDNCFLTGWNYRGTKRLYPYTRNIVLRLDMDIEETIFPNTSSCSVLTAIPRPEQPMYTKGAPLVCPTESSRYYVVGAWSTSLNGAIQFTDIRKLKEWIYRELHLYNIVL
ncbi:phenoloxidase-activating factor 2-like [Drosophila mauritiana]|uniref:Phenoloxidase-activating factor 2-like n=1 Tax=Drosophila mauritiana TaxID=7226 RepID=A0A6P8KU59_DROMA|nr:phenoloxidase-activating factor 2-like [Drosophila mauritiana]